MFDQIPSILFLTQNAEKRNEKEKDPINKCFAIVKIEVKTLRTTRWKIGEKEKGRKKDSSVRFRMDSQPTWYLCCFVFLFYSIPLRLDFVAISLCCINILCVRLFNSIELKRSNDQVNINKVNQMRRTIIFKPGRRRTSKKYYLCPCADRMWGNKQIMSTNYNIMRWNIDCFIFFKVFFLSAESQIPVNVNAP